MPWSQLPVFVSMSNIQTSVALLSVQGRKLRLSDGKGEKGDGKQVCQNPQKGRAVLGMSLPRSVPLGQLMSSASVLLGNSVDTGLSSCHPLDLSCFRLPPLPRSRPVVHR